MCGRYGRRGDKQRIAEAFQLHGSLEEVEFGDDLDCAPGSVQPVVRSSDAKRELVMMRWGYKLPDRFLFNVRSEEVMSEILEGKFAEHRCIVPALMYYEWQDCDTKPKPKYEIDLPGRNLFGIAAVWSLWKNPRTDGWEKTFSTFTSEPNALIEKIHIRQPVIIDPRDYEEWLTETERPPAHLLRVFPDDQMRMAPINPPKPEKERLALPLFDRGSE